MIFISENTCYGVICLSLEEGLSGHCLIWASGMLPPKFGLIIGCLVFTEYFFVKNKTSPRSNHFLKIQWKIHFLTFLNIDRNSAKNFLNRSMDIIISNLLLESIFDFGKWSNGKYTNMCSDNKNTSFSLKVVFFMYKNYSVFFTYFSSPTYLMGNAMWKLLSSLNVTVVWR